MKRATLKTNFTPEEATSIQSLFIIPKQSLLKESIGCSGSTIFRDLIMAI